MNVAKQLDKSSGLIFLLGFSFSKIQLIPIPLLAFISNIFSLSFYFIAYLLWSIASALQPYYSAKTEGWYGFSQFREQFFAAALLGTLATACCFVGIAFPPALIPAAWIFTLSNSIWLMGEIHKYNKPPNYDEQYSSDRQEVYLRYVTLTTNISLINAVTLTAILIFPVISSFLLALSGIICLGIALTACSYWMESQLCHYPPDNLGKSSYQRMNQTISLKPTIEHSNSLSPLLDEAQNYSPIFAPSPSPEPIEIDLNKSASSAVSILPTSFEPR